MKDLDWSNLGFGYRRTDYNVRCYYRDGKWGEIEVCSSEYVNLHMAATCLHYGQEAFEGLKAFRCPDGKVRVFRMDENAARLQSTCRGIMMPEVSTELFEEMVSKVVRLNQEYIPTYESGASLYPSAPHRNKRTGWCASGYRVCVHHLRNTGRPLLQGRILYQSLRYHSRLRPLCSSRNR